VRDVAGSPQLRQISLPAGLFSAQTGAYPSICAQRANDFTVSQTANYCRIRCRLKS
jgi:hypothetical protein